MNTGLLQVSTIAFVLAMSGMALDRAKAVEGVTEAPATKADLDSTVHNPARIDVPGKGRVATGVNSPSAVERGRYIAVSGDCVACHSIPGARKPFAGGYKLQTPLRYLIVSNITPDRETGIGGWTEKQFSDALRKGKGRDGENLYPAMPYTAYAKMTDQDVSDLYAYMQTVTPISNSVDTNQLPFPFNIRLFIAGWNLLFFDSEPLAPVAGKGAQWERGRYLVEALEHCAACHTPKNLLGGDSHGKAFQGAELQGWFTPDITGNVRTGIGGWSEDQLVEYLRTGNNDFSVASGPMAEAVTNSTQHLTEPDLKAMAVYLKRLGPSAAVTQAQALSSEDPRMQSGQRVYSANCEASHSSIGEGVSNMVVRFAGSASIQAPQIDSLLDSLLVGSRGAVTAQSPTGAGMPAFAWKLSDEQVANVLTYIRNQRGNVAEPVSPTTVSKARATLGAPVQMTVVK